VCCGWVCVGALLGNESVQRLVVMEQPLCATCNRRFTTLRGLRVHQRVHQRDVSLVEGGAKQDTTTDAPKKSTKEEESSILLDLTGDMSSTESSDSESSDSESSLSSSDSEEYEYKEKKRKRPAGKNTSTRISRQANRFCIYHTHRKQERNQEGEK